MVVRSQQKLLQSSAFGCVQYMFQGTACNGSCCSQAQRKQVIMWRVKRERGGRER